MYPADIADRLICVIPTSPVKSHPSTEMIDRTIASVRAQVGPNVLVIILADGVRDEQRELLKPYISYLGQLRRTYGLDMHNFLMQFAEHKHQVGMMRWLFQKGMFALRKQPHILFVEHDCPLTLDPIDWGNVLSVLDDKVLDMVRFLYEGDIHPEHRHMVMDGFTFGDQDYIRTRQFSARPHVATWQFYELALAQFSPDANSFIEDKMHGVVLDNPDVWRIGIYYPPPPRGRSYHLDGRAGEEKFEGKQRF